MQKFRIHSNVRDYTDGLVSFAVDYNVSNEMAKILGQSNLVKIGVGLHIKLFDMELMKIILPKVEGVTLNKAYLIINEIEKEYNSSINAPYSHSIDISIRAKNNIIRSDDDARIFGVHFSCSIIKDAIVGMKDFEHIEDFIFETNMTEFNMIYKKYDVAMDKDYNIIELIEINDEI